METREIFRSASIIQNVNKAILAHAVIKKCVILLLLGTKLWNRKNKKEFSVEIIIEELDYFMVNCKLTSN